MALTINTNLEAMNASRNLNGTENMLAPSMQRLSSGLKINSAADDVAGYAISQSLQSQVNGLNQASENIQDAVALAQTAQGALNDVAQMLQRVRELAVQYSNGTTSEEDQTAIISEVAQLTNEIKRVGETTQFNGKNLLDAAEEIRFQVGANDGEGISVTTVKLYESIEKGVDSTTLGGRLLSGLGEAEKEEVKEIKEEIKTEQEAITALQKELAKGGKTEAEVKEVETEETELKEKVAELNGKITTLNEEHPHGAEGTQRSDRQSPRPGRRIRSGAGPYPVHPEQPGSLQPEPQLGCQRARRREHGHRNDRIHEGSGSAAGRRVDSRARQPAARRDAQAPGIAQEK